MGRAFVRAAAATLLAGGAVLGVESLLVTRREFLSADTAPAVAGAYGRAFAPPLRLAVLRGSTPAGVRGARPRGRPPARPPRRCGSRCSAPRPRRAWG